MGILVTNLTNKTLSVGSAIIPRHGIEMVEDLSRMDEIRALAAAGYLTYETVEDEETGGIYVPTTLTINGQPLTDNIVLTAADIGAVSTSLTVNGQPLTSNVSLTAADVAVTLTRSR